MKSPSFQDLSTSELQAHLDTTGFHENLILWFVIIAFSDCPFYRAAGPGGALNLRPNERIHRLFSIHVVDQKATLADPC